MTEQNESNNKKIERFPSIMMNLVLVPFRIKGTLDGRVDIISIAPTKGRNYVKNELSNVLMILGTKITEKNCLNKKNTPQVIYN